RDGTRRKSDPLKAVRWRSRFKPVMLELRDIFSSWSTDGPHQNRWPRMTGFTADRLLLFGSTGDLARRMLLPSLCALDADGLLDPKLEIIGTARSDLDDRGFMNMAREALEQFLPADRRGGMAQFLNRL